jgi:gas vesicle protein
MLLIIPFVIGAIGTAVGAVVGISTAKASSEKYKQEAKHHRKVANELTEKYSKLQKRYYELADESKAQIKEFQKQLAISEVEKDALHLVVELQNRQFKDEMQRGLMKQRILRKGCDSRRCIMKYEFKQER